MAIYSCNLKSIGKTTHAEGTAGAHIRYIARADVEPIILHHAFAKDPANSGNANAGRAFLNAAEKSDRVNGRVCEKIRIALPKELNEKQRAELVQDFMHDLTGGRVPWFAAIHQTGKDAHNPHSHIVIRDRDIETGKRVLRLSDSVRDRTKLGLPGPKAVDWVRERWEMRANRSLEKAGRKERITRLSLKAQGIDRIPTIHVGPNAQHIEKMVERPKSGVRPKGQRSNRLGREWDNWVSDYPMIDAGRTRRERNTEIIDINLERNIRSKDFATRTEAQFQKQQASIDRILENKIIEKYRRHTITERRVRKSYKKKLKYERQKRTADLELGRAWTKTKFSPALARLKSRQEKELKELTKKHDKFINRLWSTLDISGSFRNKQEMTKTSLLKAHRGQQKAFREKYREEVQKRLEGPEKRYMAQKKAIQKERNRDLLELKAIGKQNEKEATALLQTREADRDQGQQALEKTIAEWKNLQKSHEKTKQQEQGHDRGRERKRGHGPSEPEY
ncbi:MAG: MobA/MobL family protein [Nitrospinales bacterium]